MKHIRTNTAPAPLGPYEQAVIHNDIIYVSMQLPLLPHEADPSIPGSIEEQAQRVLDNIKSILEASGSSMNKTLRVMIYLTDLSLGKRVNAVYERYFPAHKPARGVIEVTALPLGYGIAMDAIAAVKDYSRS